MKYLASLAVLALAGSMTASAAATPLDAVAAKARIDALLKTNYPSLESLYKDIHAHPETAFRETRTAALLAQHMRQIGFEVTEGIGKTGIVAVFRNGSGPTILVRTELDGLALQEKTGLPYASTYQEETNGTQHFTMHGCGHDTHMAWWVGTAQALIAMKDQWRGTLLFVGQPAEETVSGAKAMLDDKLFERLPKPDIGFAAHVSPFPAGSVMLKEGSASSASDSLEIIFHGRGGHGSMPSATIDPVVIGAHFVSDVQTVISREKDAGAFGVITVGAFNAGTVANIIPDSSNLKLSLRSFSPENRKILNDGVRRTAKAVTDMAGAPAPEINYLSGTAAVVNDIPMVRQLGAVLRPVLGEKLQIAPANAPGGAASEDYSAFIEAGVPSVFIGIGGYTQTMIDDYKQRGQPLPVNHSPTFAPDPQSTIETGVTVLTLAVLDAARPR